MAASLVHVWNELDVARYKSEFYRQWFAGHHAGLMHHQALETMDTFDRAPTVRALRLWLLAGTKRRATLAQLVSQKPALFLPFEAALLKLGEESGALENCLRLLADYFAAEHRMIQWLKGKMSYPLFNLLAASFIAPFPLLFFGHTASYIAISFGSVTALLLAGGGMLKAAAAWYGQRPKLVLARLLRALTTAMEAGLSVDRAVTLAVDASGSEAIKAHIRRQGKAVGRQPLGKTFDGCPIVPRQAVAAMNVAEATGDYSSTLQKLAELYDEGFSKSGTSLAFPP
ncbi:MAG: hypothetical protein A2085_02230 [Gemmatimonadetes bacterium GWC2_71_10]|nr:MAG: hypothetical protein A2085_02230 [Gemmatimonadetes bacterium GWC2_71_10]